MFIKKNNFVEKTLAGAVSFFKESIYSEEYASKGAFLQRLNPRIKILSFLFFIISILFIKNVIPILALYGVTLLLAAFSKIDLVYFLKRTWVFIPLFSLFIAVPALFSVFSPGEGIFEFNIFQSEFVVTKQGLMAAGLFVSRVISSVSIAVLLSLTTKHSEILYTLKIFRIPPIFIMTLGMCYRYIYFFIKILEDVHTAIKGRTGGITGTRQGQKVVSWNMANLWYRSYQMHKEVFNAMLSRGYAGNVYVVGESKINLRDWIWLAASLGVCIGLFLLKTGV